MLVEFRLRNFRCFRDEQVLSMVASKDDSLPENLITDVPNLGHNLLRSAAIYGPNASGKTTILDALNVVQTMVRTSARGKPEDALPVEPFLLDPATRDAPSWFELTFIHEGVRYQYGFEADRRRVHVEYLYAVPRGRTAMLFERKYDAAAGKDEYHFGASLRGQRGPIQDATRPNALFLSVAASLNQVTLQGPYAWLAQGLHGIQAHRVGVLQPMRIDEDLHEPMRALLRMADLGIDDYRIDPMPDDNKRMVVFPAAVRLDVSGERTLTIDMLHHTVDGQTVPISLSSESRGTLVLFAMGGPVFAALSQPRMLFVDELDASLHPSLVRRLVELFHHAELNSKGAQLLFNVHDTTLMDNDLLRRDQIWFTEKAVDGAARLYPLPELHHRRGAAIARGYLQGRFGALPVLGSPRDLMSEAAC